MKKYYPALDGLRLLASLNIVLLHLDSSWLLTYARDWPWIYPLIRSPLFGSSVFFVLAGFIYSVKFSDALRIPSTGKFLWERFKRLYPLHLLSLFIMVGYVGFKTDFFQDPAWVVRSIALHASWLWAFWPQGGHSLNQPSWALSAFMLSYALAPRFAKYLNTELPMRQLWKWAFLLWFPGVLWGTLFVQVDYTDARYLMFHIFPPVRVCEFLLGMVLARIQMRGGLEGPRSAWGNDLAFLGVIGLIVANIHFHRTPFPWVNWFSHHSVNTMLYAIMLLLLAQGHGRIARLFSWKPIRMIGKASFYPYLWHMPVIGIVYFVTEGLGLPIQPNHWVGTLVIVVAVYGLSTWFNERQKS